MAEVKAKEVTETNENDPVKIKCGAVAWPKPDPRNPVDHGPLPKALTFVWAGTKYEVPVGGEMKNTMPRVGAEFIIARATRHWTLKAELSIMEPTFK